MERFPRRFRWALLGAILGIFGFAVPAAEAGNGVAGRGLRHIDPPLTHFVSHTLASPFGSIQAVIYDGNEEVENATNQSTIAGFTVPASPFTANTTYVVADGQCGASAMNGCATTPPYGGGSGDFARFIGSSTFSYGPDAFKGSDGCTWGVDNCLWDTRSYDVSPYLTPGATSAKVEIESALAPVPDSFDCINHEAQIFAVGPTPAWALAGYKVDGVGLRNQGAGAVTIAGVPPGTQVVAAYLYWNILHFDQPSGSMIVNGVPAPGAMFKQGIDPCWGVEDSWAFRADVTAHVAPTGGNGAYLLTGYPTGSITGMNAFATGSLEPMMEGASLAVLYEACPANDDRDHDGLEDRDESLFHTIANDPDSDHDGLKDGNDDEDHDHVDDEDEDDGPGECTKDDNHNHMDDEDEDDEEDHHKHGDDD